MRYSRVMNDPIGIAEIAERLGARPVTVRLWKSSGTGFPLPTGTVSGQPVWSWLDVFEWAEANGKLRGTGAWGPIRNEADGRAALDDIIELYAQGRVDFEAVVWVHSEVGRALPSLRGEASNALGRAFARRPSLTWAGDVVRLPKYLIALPDYAWVNEGLAAKKYHSISARVDGREPWINIPLADWREHVGSEP